jgi:hypothetical protein
MEVQESLRDSYERASGAVAETLRVDGETMRAFGESDERMETGSIATSLTSRDTMCPVCASELQSHGEVIRAFGETSQDAVQFGEILSLECGHRLHRSCMLAWLNQAPSPTCPMCRKETNWQPGIGERTNLRAIVQQGWKSLEKSEQNWIMWTWIIAGIVMLTDPIGYFIISGMFMMFTPPPFYGEMAMVLATVRKFIVSKNRPGHRIMIAVTFATIITLYILTLHMSA